ncbi:MAG: hypothetical protein RL173_913 [Fibrobacterota bacterium]
MVLLAASRLVAQESGLDSLPSPFTPDSVATWDDSTRTQELNGSSARWTMASRDGTVRRALSVRNRDLSGITAEFQHSDPGGLRRRSLEWKREGFALRAGDLSAWSDHPLLEGSTRRSGFRDTALDGQILYGSGTKANGVDLDASWEGLRAVARRSWERDARGDLRGSGTALIQVDGFCLGLRASDSSTTAGATRVLVAGAQAEFGHVEFAWMDREHGSARAAFEASAKAKIDESRWHAKVRVVPTGFGHDGLAAGWSGTSAAQLRGERRFSSKATLGMQLDGLRDSTGKVAVRATSSARLNPFDAMDVAVRASLAENQSNASRWLVSSRVSLRLNDFAPFAEISVRDSAAIRSAQGLAGIRATRGNQELLASAAMSPLAGTTWNASHKTRVEAGPTRLEFALSANGSMRSKSAMTAQGSLACAW